MNWQEFLNTLKIEGAHLPFNLSEEQPHNPPKTSVSNEVKFFLDDTLTFVYASFMDYCSEETNDKRYFEQFDLAVDLLFDHYYVDPAYFIHLRNVVERLVNACADDEQRSNYLAKAAMIYKTAADKFSDPFNKLSSKEVDNFKKGCEISANSYLAMFNDSDKKDYSFEKLYQIVAEQMPEEKFGFLKRGLQARAESCRKNTAEAYAQATGLCSPNFFRRWLPSPWFKNNENKRLLLGTDKKIT